MWPFKKKEGGGKDIFAGISGITDDAKGLIDKVSGFQLPTVKTQNTVALDPTTIGTILAVLVAIYLIFKKRK